MVCNEDLKYKIPDGWEVKKLSKLIKCNYSSIGKNYSNHQLEYLDTGSLTKNVIEFTESINTETDQAPSRAKRIINKNDILYSTVRPKLCHYGIMKDPTKNMIGSTGFAQLSSKIDMLSNDLIYTYLTSTWVTKRLHQIAALAVSAYPSISANDILDLHMALPKNMNDIDPINLKLDTIYSKISLNQKENKKLTELRDWLLPMLMNGQVTFKDA
jgi:type I restriction enzyme S subunit